MGGMDLKCTWKTDAWCGEEKEKVARKKNG